MGRALVNKNKKGGVTPVPNGPLVKKSGSTLKKGGKLKLKIK